MCMVESLGARTHVCVCRVCKMCCVILAGQSVPIITCVMCTQKAELCFYCDNRQDIVFRVTSPTRDIGLLLLYMTDFTSS